ncbi:hypothetical protein LR48_Vigan10g252900 [Vigna angularis]|uniref:TF-B3 domain-containing protein n=1 Tax=Phaseolus angularis TaxID=3914 RepID=A0A0L9VP08_PHAAN|nr:hypothetical protein LR48_Vigan10g252900 [Vigna angularis]
MAASTSAQTLRILWKFGSIYFSHSDIGYVDRHFDAAFQNELGPTWSLVDNNGHTHVVTYNMDTINPRITNGWAQMRNIYPERLNDSHISFHYVGNNTFHITIYFGACSRESRESFIYDSTNYPDTSLFPVKLTKSQSQGSHLVRGYFNLFFVYTFHKFHNVNYLIFVTAQDLQIAFGNLIRSKGLTQVMLLGQKDGIMCSVLVSVTRNSTKFGKGWKEFCTEYGLKEGDVLVFEVNNLGNDILVEVYINGCPCTVIHPISV